MSLKRYFCSFGLDSILIIHFLGSSRETQVDLIKQLQKCSVLNPSSQGFTSTAPPKFPEIANSFSLGYTFVEFKEYDNDGRAIHNSSEFFTR